MFYEFQLVHSGQLPLKGPVTAAASCESCVCVCIGSSLCALSERLAVFTFDEELDAVACWSDAECLAAAADRCMELGSFLEYHAHSDSVGVAVSMSCHQG
jgi:hypothetical protein